MTLLELLVKELPKLGGWPKNLPAGTSSPSGCAWKMPPWGCSPISYRNLSHEIVTREQYEAAIAAQQPAWNGEGLPPAECECEVRRVAEWMPVTIKFISEYHTVFKTFGGAEDCYQTCSLQFRPIRTVSERKRDIAVGAMERSWESVTGVPAYDFEKIYDDIAAGKIPGVRLADETGSQ